MVEYSINISDWKNDSAPDEQNKKLALENNILAHINKYNYKQPLDARGGLWNELRRLY